MLNIPILAAAQKGDWTTVDFILSMNHDSQYPTINLTENMLAAASKDDWQTVFLCLDINNRSQIQVLDIRERHNEHQQRWRLFDYASGKFLRHSVNGNQRLDLYLMSKYGVQPSYDLEVFRFAKAGNWKMVYNHLNLNHSKNGSLFDIHARDEFHPQGWRLFDYAEAHDTSMVPQLWRLGLRPSYDIKFFQAASTGEWETVFYYIDNNLVHVNIIDEWDPLKRTVLNHAIAQGHHEAINGLMIDRGAIETPMDYNAVLPLMPQMQAVEASHIAAPVRTSMSVPLVQRTAVPLEAQTSIDQTALFAPRAVFSPAFQAASSQATVYCAPRPQRVPLIDYLEQPLSQPQQKRKNQRGKKNLNSYQAKGFF